MEIQNNLVVSIHYRLTDDDGNLLDSSDGQSPLKYLHGAGGIVTGLEKELTGKIVGDKLQVTVQPADGYGLVKPELLQQMPRDAFDEIEDLQVGMHLHAEDADGNGTMIVVREIDDDKVTIDSNHPLAGMVLNFNVTIEAIREATLEELEHGHAH